jgi:hypothetical protein
VSVASAEGRGTTVTAEVPARSESVVPTPRRAD